MSSTADGIALDMDLEGGEAAIIKSLEDLGMGEDESRRQVAVPNCTEKFPDLEPLAENAIVVCNNDLGFEKFIVL